MANKLAELIGVFLLSGGLFLASVLPKGGNHKDTFLHFILGIILVVCVVVLIGTWVVSVTLWNVLGVFGVGEREAFPDLVACHDRVMDRLAKLGLYLSSAQVVSVLTLGADYPSRIDEAFEQEAPPSRGAGCQAQAG